MKKIGVLETYPIILTNIKAFYFFLQIESTGSLVKSISKELNQSENLIRYIFIKVKDHQELPTKMNNEKK